MASPLRTSFDPLNDPLNPAAGRFPPSRAPDRGHRLAAEEPRPPAAGNDDLQRLESSVAWLKREGMIARLAAEPRGREAHRRLPRAVQLPPIPGIPPVGTEGSGHTREVFAVAPPLACERLPLPPSRRQHRRNLRGAVCLLIASAIVGSIAYHVSAGGLLSAWEPAQAASLRAQ
jgi:hypothetical protein